MKKEILIGFLIGVVASVFGFIFGIQIFGNSSDWGLVVERSINQGFFTKLMSIGAALNLGVFFLFLKKNKDQRAKGVLISTILMLIITMAIKFLN
ncbi:MAG: hypothetical protein ABJQ39_11565 [Winogradskyella arenosi]|uniref:Uncharacterized protein n=1 Tax=Winogradskyella arenosi TaxID=533325 RepID=A0A368ZBR9_9FLAO|nr:hypothetical protein [Winogradskyella arenosi]RCW90310.1 hypothetical protein DFQ08_105200 [Winogradskyella arenosi]